MPCSWRSGSVWAAPRAGWPLWAAIGISSAIFGFVHLYQGLQGVVRTGIVGLVLGAVYGLTGSLIAPIVLHAVIDLTSGRIGQIVIGENEPGNLDTTSEPTRG